MLSLKDVIFHLYPWILFAKKVFNLLFLSSSCNLESGVVSWTLLSRRCAIHIIFPIFRGAYWTAFASLLGFSLSFLGLLPLPIALVEELLLTLLFFEEILIKIAVVRVKRGVLGITSINLSLQNLELLFYDLLTFLVDLFLASLPCYIASLALFLATLFVLASLGLFWSTTTARVLFLFVDRFAFNICHRFLLLLILPSICSLW